MRSWGKWDSEPVWQLQEGNVEIEAVAMVEARKIPVCVASVR